MSMKNGGPAFPMQEPQAIHAYAVAAIDGITDHDERDRAYLKARAEAVGGATLRDYFAAKAMQGLMASPADPESMEVAAKWSYKLADAMLKAREEKP